MSTTREKDLAFAYWAQNAGVPRSPSEAFADGCAHRDRQTIAFLRERATELDAMSLHKEAAELGSAAECIERGEHVK